MTTNLSSKLLFNLDFPWRLIEQLQVSTIRHNLWTLNKGIFRVHHTKIDLESKVKIGFIKHRAKCDKGHFQFSLSELVWLFIFRELRKFGMPPSKIVEVKESIIGKIEDYREEFTAPYLDYFLIMAIKTKTPYSLFVFADTDAIICQPSTISLNNKFKRLPSYLEISINSLLQEIYPNKDLNPKYLNETFVSDQELLILDRLKSQELNELRIKVTGGKPVMLFQSFRYQGNPPSRSLQFGEINRTIHNSKVDYSVITIKEKI